jgi:hypothetical protein
MRAAAGFAGELEGQTAIVDGANRLIDGAQDTDAQLSLEYNIAPASVAR